MRVQFWIECLSVSLTLMGGTLIAATPLLLILVFAVPDESVRDCLRLLIFSAFLTAFLLIGASGLLGNLYYHYDERDQRFKFRLHCGSGPADHFFADDWSRVSKTADVVAACETETAGSRFSRSPVTSSHRQREAVLEKSREMKPALKPTTKTTAEHQLDRVHLLHI